MKERDLNNTDRPDDQFEELFAAKKDADVWDNMPKDSRRRSFIEFTGKIRKSRIGRVIGAATTFAALSYGIFTAVDHLTSDGTETVDWSELEVERLDLSTNEDYQDCIEDAVSVYEEDPDKNTNTLFIEAHSCREYHEILQYRPNNPND